jgi:sulfur carrier protein
MNTHETLTQTLTLSLTLDGHSLTAPAGTTLAELLAQHPASAALAPESYASAVNGQFVPRAQRVSHPLQDGDAVTLFQAIVGG